MPPNACALFSQIPFLAASDGFRMIARFSLSHPSFFLCFLFSDFLGGAEASVKNKDRTRRYVTLQGFFNDKYVTRQGSSRRRT